VSERERRVSGGEERGEEEVEEGLYYHSLLVKNLYSTRDF
jgi:hypothetical protein